ncbi:MAG: gliding motility-associated C-terminal domain-containing protein [Saprospiraceae bacterium]|nr:gliding motility-associated C-terminal domain-containing protein [Saprospiraceae bacterium]MBK9729286.1 gliding motility-associated C-terminal domain-containing protein [Saprospiraceae bacterium]
MKKYIISLAVLCCYVLGQAQLNFQIANVSGNKNDTISVPVTVTGFTNVLTTQFSMHYDSNVLAIVDVIKTGNFDVNFSTHVGSTSVKNGQIGFTWDAPGGVGKNITNGTTIFSMRFKLIGKECDSSFVKLADKPASIEVLDGNFNNLTLNATTGKVKINGTGCQGGPPPVDSSLQIIASTETTPQGVVTCLKVTAKGFKNIQTAQFTMHWDKAVVVFDTIKSLSSTPPVGSIQLSWGQNYASLPDRSGVGINWDAGANPVTIADGATLFEVCLKPVGAPGAMSAVTFDGTPVLIEVTNGNGDVVTPKFTSGKVTITDAPAASLNLYVRDTTVEEGSEFCIPIRVDNFKCVSSFQFSTNYDTTKLKLLRINGITLPGLGPNNFNIIKDSVRVTWDAQSGSQDLPNGGILFNICFESRVGVPCPFDTKLVFTDLTGSPMEFADCNSKNFNVIKGEPDFTVKCKTSTTPVSISLGTVSSVKCFGDCNGSVKGTVISGGKGPFTYEWKLQPSNVTVSTVLEPNDLCPGSYKLSVIDNGDGNKVTTSIAIQINEPAEIELTAITKDVVISSDGAIDLTVIGGTPGFTYKWRRLSANPINVGTTEDITSLVASNYEIMVTDANGCIKMDTFTVNPRKFEILTVTLADSNRCNGECRAKPFVSGAYGKVPYRFIWSNGDTINPPNGLCKGSYTVTVSDALGTSATRVIVITEPDAIVITIDSVKKSSGTNGAAFITIKGGTLAYKSFQWKNSSGVIISTEEDLRNAAPDTYTFCVTDKNDCTKCDTVVVQNENSVPPTITVDLKVDPKAGGTAVTCNGKCDGKIIVTVTHSDPKPHTYKYKWSHDINLNSSIATDLCPGTGYTVTVTDEAGNSKVSTPLIVPDAPAISLVAKRLNCASNSSTSDGKYEALITGGSSPFSFEWCSGSLSKIADNLPIGPCLLKVTDVNGCTAVENFTVCGQTQSPECYKGRLAISPNGDGYNEVLEISCVSQTDNVLTIFDRWGNQVNKFVNYVNTWNGIDSDGDDLTEGTYMWILKVTEAGKNDAYYKGAVTIVR